MKIDIAEKGAALLERIKELESVIFKLEQIIEGESFSVSGVNNKITTQSIEINFNEGKLSTEIFKQNILDYAINNFNIELGELKQELESLEP